MNGEMKRRPNGGLGLSVRPSTLTASTSQQKEKAESRESLEFYSRHQEAHDDRAAVRAEIEILRRERLTYKQESIETRQALSRSEAYSRALEA
ncbi:hypothetical protein Tco_1548838 [Tanacetum coccineum]